MRYGWIEFQSSGWEQGWGAGAMEGRVTEVMCSGMTRGCPSNVMKSSRAWRALHPFPIRDAGCWPTPQLKQRRYLSLSRRDPEESEKTQREKTERAARCNHSLPTFLGAEKGGIISAVTCKWGQFKERLFVQQESPCWLPPPCQSSATQYDSQSSSLEAGRAGGVAWGMRQRQ